MLSPRVQSSLMNFHSISEGICTFRVQSQCFNLTFLNIHAPTEETEDIKKAAFYALVKHMYENIRKKDIKSIPGDYNAKVGREQICKQMVGIESLYKISSGNGIRYISLASSKNMIISATFPHNNIPK